MTDIHSDRILIIHGGYSDCWDCLQTWIFQAQAHRVASHGYLSWKFSTGIVWHCICILLEKNINPLCKSEEFDRDLILLMSFAWLPYFVIWCEEKIWGLISRVQIFLLSSVYWNSVRSKTFVFVENINTTTTFNKNSSHLLWRKFKSQKILHNFWHWFLALFTKPIKNLGVPEMIYCKFLL